MTKKSLIPADTSQCQAMVKEGSFMTLGPRSWDRCTKKPTVVVSEEQPGKDGQKGSMSMCQECFEVFQLTLPQWTDFYSSKKIRRSKK